jgi:hypothetical protein
MPARSPDILRASLTWGLGIEMHEWKDVSIAADIDIYFCDPQRAPPPGALIGRRGAPARSVRTETCFRLAGSGRVQAERPRFGLVDGAAAGLCQRTARRGILVGC